MKAQRDVSSDVVGSEEMEREIHLLNINKPKVLLDLCDLRKFC